VIVRRSVLALMVFVTLGALAGIEWARPFSDEELTTLARRSREAFRTPKRGKARLERCAGELGKQHGAEPVIRVVNALEAINNEIGYEEK